MARPQKIGIPSFPLDIDIFSDEKVLPISVEFGIKGEILIIRILCAIYRNGYFLEWSDIMKYRFAREVPSASPDLIDQVVARLVKWGFFDKRLFDTAHVLTSAGIQRRFIAARPRLRDDLLASPICLISSPDALPAPKFAPAQIDTKAPTQDPHDKYLQTFFDFRNTENHTLLCKNLGITDIKALRLLADAVIAEWKISKTNHLSYTDWSRHLIATIRLKALSHKPTPQPQQPTAPTDYGQGFGSSDI